MPTRAPGASARSQQRAGCLFYGHPGYGDRLLPRGRAGVERDLPSRYLQLGRKEPDQLIVRRPFDRRRRQPDLDRLAVHSHCFAAGGARLHVDPDPNAAAGGRDRPGAARAHGQLTIPNTSARATSTTT